MHKLSQFCLTLLLACTAPAAAWAQLPTLGDGPRTLRVMTYNIRHGGEASLEELAALIRAQQPDLVALQEVDCRTRREDAPAQHDKDQITQLGQLTGMFPLYGKTIPLTGGWYGIGILSRRPYTRVEKSMLPKADPSEEARALLLAEVEVGDRDTVVFACTHIDFTTPQTRMAQCRTVAERLAEERHPVIVGGDFNSLPGSPEIASAFGRWKPLSADGPTSPADAPKEQIDYLWGYPAGKWRLRGGTILPVTLSDHRPVVSEVELLR